MTLLIDRHLEIDCFDKLVSLQVFDDPLERLLVHLEVLVHFKLSFNLFAQFDFRNMTAGFACRFFNAIDRVKSENVPVDSLDCEMARARLLRVLLDQANEVLLDDF